MYWYADWCRACVELRHRVVENPGFAQVFVGTHIVALDFESLRSVKDKPEVWTPMIIPIESDGTLGKIAVNGVPWDRAPKDVFEVPEFPVDSNSGARMAQEGLLVVNPSPNCRGGPANGQRSVTPLACRVSPVRDWPCCLGLAARD